MIYINVHILWNISLLEISVYKDAYRHVLMAKKKIYSKIIGLLIHWKPQNVDWWKKLRKTNKLKDIPYSWTGKLSISPKWPTDSKTSSSKFQPAFFTEIDKLILQFVWQCEGPKITKTILKKKTYIPIPKLTTKQQ